MLRFLKIVKRSKKLIPESYGKHSYRFLFLSIAMLFLDVFSIFLLIPLVISLLDQSSDHLIFSINFSNNNRFILIILTIVFFVFKNYLAILINKYQTKIAYQLSSEYSLSLSKHYVLGNYLSFKNQKKSSILKEIIFVANDFVGNILLSINIILTELFLLFILFIIGLIFYFKITLIMVIVIGLIIYISRIYNQKEIDFINKSKSKDYDANISHLSNLLNGYMSIKSPDILKHFLDTFNDSNKKLNNNYSILHAKKINSSKQTEILLVLLLCSVFAIIHFFSFSTYSTTLFLSVFGALLFKAIPSINKLNIGQTNLNAHLYALDILEEKISEIKNVETESKPIHFKNSINLEKISFSYEINKPIISNLSIKINKGDFVAISGVSGQGKTTLLNIISKLIDPHTGNITVDKTLITNTNKYNYFKLITYLTQKPFIYEGTILDNLLFNDKKYNVEKLNRILTSLELLETIEKLPNKFETYIGNEGNNLSGGQLQRLCIARAILNKPEILILDEATNNLDKETEAKVLNYLKGYSQKTNTTIISVSHHFENNKDLFNNKLNLDLL